MKRYTLILNLISINSFINSYAQDSLFKDTVSFSKHDFSVELGLHRSSFTGKRYIQPPVCDWRYDCRNFGGYYEFPTTGLQLGFLYTYSHQLIKHFKVGSGLYIVQRYSEYKGDSATLRKAGQSNLLFTHLEYRPITLELPVNLVFFMNNASISLGIHRVIALYGEVKKTQAIGKKTVVRRLELSFLTYPSEYNYDNYYLSLKFYYNIKNKLHDFQLFCGIYTDFYLSYYRVQGGLNIPIYSINN